MTITAKMLLIRYFERNPDSVASYKSDPYTFDGIRLLPAEGSGQKPAELPPSFLYVTDCTDLSYLSRFDSSIRMISFSDDPPEISDLSTCIFVKTEQCLAFCFNELQACFDEFAGWEQALHEAVLKQASFQELLELSEAFIPSAMLIYDPALKLLAWSRSHEQLDDPIFQNAIRDGFLNADAVHYFERTHAFENMNTSGVAAGESDSYHKHADYLRSVCVNDQLAVFADVSLAVGDCADRILAGTARHAPSQAAVPGSGRLLVQALEYQQCRDLRQCRVDHQQRR